MKQSLCVLSLLFVGSVAPAWAQRPSGAGVAGALSAPQAEISGGFSFIRDSGINLKGFNGSGAFNLNRWLGLAADFGGHYTTIPSPIPGFPDVSDHAYTFTFGPRVSYRTDSRFTPFFHILAGGIRESASAGSVSTSQSGFALLAGGGLDVEATNSLSIRLIQVDALNTHVSGSSSTNPRLTFGVVWRIGSKHR